METDDAESVRGVAAASADIAAARLQYRWLGNAGHWGHWIVSELEKQFGVGVNDRLGVCFVTALQIAFNRGYNATLAVEINQRRGAGAFESVFSECCRQSEEALGDARRAWCDRHAEP